MKYHNSICTVLICAGVFYSTKTPAMEENLENQTEPQSDIENELIDLSGVAQIEVDNFDYQIFENKTQTLSINCKRAIASYKQQDVVLRGHVIITSADGSRLESNHVKWDINKDLFKVDGIFFLSKKGKKLFGRAICVDKNLNYSESENGKLTEMEAKKCYTKL